MPATLEIHQFVPSLAPRDAVGQHSLALQAFLRSLGVESQIFADEIKPGMESKARPFNSFRGSSNPNRYLIYQASTNSPIAEFLSNRPEKKLVNFHNITPSAMLLPWEFGAGLAMAMASHQVGKFSHHSTLAFTVSRYNQSALRTLGYKSTALAAPFIELGERHYRTPKKVDKGASWLFVGRVFPNKAQMQLVAALACYRKIYDSTATLTLVGSLGSKTYHEAIVAYAKALGLEDAVFFAGQVTDEELLQLYRGADLFTCASRHEGFCFPLIEAMRNSLPIVAYSSSAIPETLGAGGVLVEHDDPMSFAGAAHMLLGDIKLQGRTAEGAEIQLERYSPQSARREHHRVLRTVIEDLPELREETGP